MQPTSQSRYHLLFQAFRQPLIGVDVRCQRSDLLPRSLNGILPDDEVQRRVRNARDLVESLRTPFRVFPARDRRIPPDAADIRGVEVRVRVCGVFRSPGRPGCPFGADPPWFDESDLGGRPGEGKVHVLNRKKTSSDPTLIFHAGSSSPASDSDTPSSAVYQSKQVVNR